MGIHLATGDDRKRNQFLITDRERERNKIGVYCLTLADG